MTLSGEKNCKNNLYWWLKKFHDNTNLSYYSVSNLFPLSLKWRASWNNFLFISCNSRTLYSIVPLHIKFLIWMGLVCPNLWILSTACSLLNIIYLYSTAGFHQGSTIITWFASVKFIPNAPALSETNITVFNFRSFIDSYLFSFVIEPSSLQNLIKFILNYPSIRFRTLSHYEYMTTFSPIESTYYTYLITSLIFVLFSLILLVYNFVITSLYFFYCYFFYYALLLLNSLISFYRFNGLLQVGQLSLYLKYSNAH